MTAGALRNRSVTSGQAMLMALLLLLLPPSLVAQPGTLWQLTQADAAWPAVPEQAAVLHAVLLQLNTLNQLQAGDSLQVTLPNLERPATLWVELLQEQLNGDLLLEARGEGFSLTLTAGAHWLFGQLEAGPALWQLQARRDVDVAQVPAWLFQAHGLHHAADGPDYLIPDPAQLPASRRQLPMTLQGALNGEGSLLQQAVTDARGVRLNQRFSEAAILVGSNRNLQLQVELQNESGRLINPGVLEIFFLLEEASLLQMPGGCTTRNNSAGQRFLRCQLPTLAAGQQHQLMFDLTVPARASAGRLWSTTLLNGDLRHDLPLNVVQDVLRGDIGDALSDFNVVLAADSPRDPRGNVVIDVMALYTAQARSLYDGRPETRVNQLIAVANQIYRDSGVGITLRPVLHRQVHYPAAGNLGHMLEDMTYVRHPAFAEVAQWREDYGADLVMLFHPIDQAGGLCGMANLGGLNTRGDLFSFNEREFAFSVIGIDCPVTSVLAHEVGHNLGLTHSHREDGQGGTLPWATGYGVNGAFVTVMADPGRFNHAERVARFSNPRLNCFGQPCGESPGPNRPGADASHALNLVRFQVANYYPTRVPPLPSRMVASASGNSTSTRIAMAAVTDGGRRFLERPTPRDLIDIRAEFHVDEQHVGREAIFHVLVETRDGPMHFTQQRGLVAGWDGEVDSLLPFSDTPQPLEHQVVLPLVERYRPEQGLVGQRLHIYVAYRLLDSNELIYSLQPLTLDVIAAP